ncbi:MAG TPA: hypothetical protein VEG38_14435, partial [Acidimicrobiia bacterium]|nr:hypothetical protein [Acidimicrobiia bacterium]
TNAPSPVSPNAGNGSGELRADLALVVSPAVVGFTDVEREPVPEAGGYALTLTSAGLLTDAVVEALLAAGWRPPLPNGGQNLAENAGRVMVKRLLAHRWPGGDWANSSLSHIAEVALAGVMPFLDEPPAARVVEEAGRG